MQSQVKRIFQNESFEYELIHSDGNKSTQSNTIKQ